MSTPPKPSTPDPTALSYRELQQQLQSIQVRAFALFEDAAQQAEADPARADAAYLHAQEQAKPLLQQGEALRVELVKRARQRARRAWMVVWVALGLLAAIIVLQIAR